MSAFEELGVMPSIIKAVEEMDWLLPTPVQAEAIPLILGGGDVLAAAETGSGKTGAFCLPIVQIVHETLRDATIAKKPAKGPLSDHFVLNPDDRAGAFAIADDMLTCQSRHEFDWEGCRSTIGVLRGKYYYEATVTDEGLCRVGFSTIAGGYNLGTDKQSFGFGGTGKASHNNQFNDYGATFGKDDVIGAYLDLDTWTISFSKNGAPLGKAFDIPKYMQGSAIYPAVVLKNAEMSFNFGATPFAHAPGGGFIGFQQADAANTSMALVAGDPGRRTPSCIILEPSKELADQVKANLELFRKYIPEPVPQEVVLVGGTDVKPQMSALKRGVDIVVATAGRAQSLLEQGLLDLSNIRFFVLDEADQLISDGGQREIIMGMYSKLPKTTKGLQVLLFSATLHSPEVRALAEKITRFPTWVDLKGRDSVPETVHHCMVRVDPTKDDSYRKAKTQTPTDEVHAGDKKMPLATPEAISEGIKLMKAQVLLKVIEAFQMDQALIFCRTKVDCDNLETFLNSLSGGRGVVSEMSCASLHSGRSLPERRSNLEAFKSGEVRFLICTDVAARGIDISGLPYVINYTLPEFPEEYIHRIGRVGRADRMGLAISLVAQHKEKVWYHTCPSKGNNCSNIRLVDNGGCCIWWDEPAKIGAIQERLDEPIEELDSDYKLPSGLVAGGDVTYGAKRAKKGAPTAEEQAVMKLVADIAPSVESLTGLEVRVQHSFLTMRARAW